MSAPKKSVFLISTGLILLILALFLFFNTPNHRFEKLCDSVFIKELSNDGLSLHYTLDNPNAYGITDATPTLSSYNKTESLGDYQGLLATLEELKTINPNSLNATNRRTYEILVNFMEKEAEAYA